MLLDQLAVHHDVGTGGAEIGRAALSFAKAAQKLDLDRDRKILVLGHRLRRLAVEHHAAVARGPAFAARTLVAYKPIFDADSVVRESVFVEDVAVLAIEFVVLVVRDFHDAIFDAKSVAEIVAQFVALDLGRPATEVFAIKEADPAIGAWRRIFSRNWGRAEGDRYSEKASDCIQASRSKRQEAIRHVNKLRKLETRAPTL